MKIYSFEKSLLQRIEEYNLVLDETESDVKSLWRNFMEISIEPAGYFAIWKVSRPICEKLKVHYPFEAFGEVVETNFYEENIVVQFKIQSVQDDSVELPAEVLVNIEDIYPTKYQENNALNVEFTADCIERYRFFFKYIFLPFDENDGNWASKNLDSRIQNFYDLKSKKISKRISCYMRELLSKAKYIQHQKEILESSLENDNDEEFDMDLSVNESKEVATKLLDLHLQMNRIKDEFNVLCNPEMRDVYENLKYKDISNDKKKIFAVMKYGTINDQIQLLDSLKHRISTHTKVFWTLNLQEAISTSTHESEIYVSNAQHKLNFLEYLCDSLSISGLNKIPLDIVDTNSMNNYAVISSSELSSLLFAIDGDIRFESLIIDCGNIKTGFFIKSGSVLFTNCFITSSNQPISEAFNLSGDSDVTINDCKIINFTVGFNLLDNAKLTIKNSIITGCCTAINALNDKVEISLENSSIRDCSEYGIVKRSRKVDENQKSIDIDVNDPDNKSFNINLIEKNVFENNKKGNVKILSKLLEDDDDDIFETTSEAMED